MPRISHMAQLRCAALALLAAGAVSAPADPVSYNRDVRPILSENCFRCHGPDARTREAGLRLDARDEALAVLAPGRPEASELIRRITATDPADRMPPEVTHKALGAAQIELLTRWVAQGAPYERHWAFIPPVAPEVPAVRDTRWPKNPIDNFILARLEAEGLAPSPRADRATLLRRVSLDLTGLPPTPGAVRAFDRDTDPDAYARAVDRLLASERYGEHMALGWLEASRYADTDGYQNDRLRYQHVWRDWVIEALNENKPFDAFVIEQLAGDMLPDATLRQQIATGFNRNHRINSENGSIPEEWHVENVVDRVDTVGTVFLGLTMGCARCHDHKYDPITQREYFELFAQFNNVPEWGVGPNNGNSPPFIRVPNSWPDLAPAEDRLIPPEPVKLNRRPGSVDRPQAGNPLTVMVMAEMETPRPTYLLNRGLYSDPDTSEVLAPGAPAALLGPGQTPPANRLELARWLVEPSNPLLARVTVNRFWQHFFGTGIVATPENFGLQGAFPSHPELLDWLATTFIALDWDVKAFHRMLVTSAAYQQDSRVPSGTAARDPKNRLLSHMPRVRLTGQQLRDQALFASELLVEQVGGASVFPYMPPGLWESVSNAKYYQSCGDDLYRRSLYTYWRRTTPPPMMTGFNAANREVCIVRNELTNTPLHALTVMNNVVFVEAARVMAERMIEEHAGLEARVAAGFQRVLARRPDAVELSRLCDAHAEFHRAFSRDPDRARALLRTGDRPYRTIFDEVELASMTMVASAILNLDEAIMRN
ncbi:MAG: PSD1 domain-containing protein [Candidatus Hydrogenedentes bacterium]|nr:PSD1 domain-containing protein [Candidatus Hydrogenedentota bacterium]